MSSIISLDPLNLVALQAGNLAPPLKAEAATGNNNSQGSQRSIVIGEVVPIVFCKRDGQDGGVVVAPGATECQFSNSAITNALTARYHLVLGEGPMGSVQVRDVFIAGIRRGSISQTFDRRAGDWDPGNSVVAVANKSFRLASYNCGGGVTNGYGSYENLSTLSYSITCNDGDDAWKSQVSIFIRNGISVTRLAAGGTGASNNLVDLIYYLLQKTARIPSSLIDLPSLEAAALFLQVQSFTFDGVIDASINLRDWLSQVLPYYLLKESSINGRFALRPVVPTNSNGTINTSALSPLFVFDDTNIVAGSFEIEYIGLSERKPISLKLQWRQQEDDLWSIVRTTELQYADSPASIPNEQHDVSSYATRETHVVKAGTYLLAHRRYVTHTARVTILPGAASTAMVPGDIIQLRLTRNASTGPWGQHNQLYSVETIRKVATGEVTLELLQIPIDGFRKSLVAIDVEDAGGRGRRVVPNITDPPDVNSKTDTTVPPDTAIPRTTIPETPYTPTGGTPTPPPPGVPTTPDPLKDPERLVKEPGKLKVPDSVLENCPNPQYQWFKAVYDKNDGTVGFVPIDEETASEIALTGDLYGYKVSAGVICDETSPIVPMFPYEPVDVPSGYKVLLRYFRLDTQVVEPAIVATTYGPFGVEANYTGVGDVTGASVAYMWITNSSGQKTYTGSYFIASFGNGNYDPPWLVWISAGAVPI